MKIGELKQEIQKYQYLEDTSIIDVSLASIIATRLKVGFPVWLTIIGASSGGKSQILRPLAMTDNKYLHRIDDVTENTFLSGAKGKGGEDVSLLNNIIGKEGIIVISDLTVLMSKSSESRNTILSQFRMIYDGEMIKHTGNRKEPLKWQGQLGVLSGSTPSIYRTFEEVSDMGERFIYFRMKDFDERKATRLALNRKEYGLDLDQKLSNIYGEYIKDVVTSYEETDLELSSEDIERIIDVSAFAEKVRTPVQVDHYSKEITSIPVSALPMRVSLQLLTIAKGLMIMQKHENGTTKLTDSQLSVLDWCCYSLANEEKRGCLKILASVDFNESVSTQVISDKIGLATSVTQGYMQNLASTGVIVRQGANNMLKWGFKNRSYYDIVRRIEKIDEIEELEEREITTEELNTMSQEDQPEDMGGGVMF